jgi:hypothetical protein
MSTGSKEPEDIVKDGLEGDTSAGNAPVPRQEVQEGQEFTLEGIGSAEEQADPGSRDADREANKAVGPAEEQDAQTGDDRGLTTDSSPD